ncbi:unnamed protein product [Nezara viridula]|uniref:C2H2-type domain-containing protein n=1 Tax=Nezara viridula TaxID=85310 RepID=A0A9P0HCT1_NEZVI|nr:unnamed protein product [Nezara viridula]
MTFHVYNKHGVIKRRRYTCSTCQRTYSNRQNLNRHVKYECGKPPSFKCQFCHKGFTQNHALKVHVFKSTEEGHYCYSCGRKYKYKKHLNRHVRYECGMFQERHNCSNCYRSYKHRHHLLRHIKFHCGKPPAFHCQSCNKAFHRKDVLEVHFLSQHANLI